MAQQNETNKKIFQSVVLFYKRINKIHRSHTLKFHNYSNLYKITDNVDGTRFKTKLQIQVMDTYCTNLLISLFLFFYSIISNMT